MSSEVYLNDKQFKIVNKLVEKKRISLNDLALELGVSAESLMRDIYELENRGLVAIDKREVLKYTLTDEAVEALKNGLIEERVYDVMYRCIDRNVDLFIRCVAQEASLQQHLVRIGLQYLVKAGCLMVEGRVVKINDEDRCLVALEEASWIKAYLRSINEGVPKDVAEILKRRKLVKQIKEITMDVEAKPLLIEAYEKGLLRLKEVLTVVKPNVIKDLDKYVIKRFDLDVEYPRIKSGRSSVYMEFLDMIRDILVDMGYEEVKGNHVEIEFWNFDALFQAQDHPAREIHDTFYVKNNIKEPIPTDVLERAKNVHEKYWRYRWSVDQAFKPILRTQTTAVTIRTLYERGGGEYRVFTIDRVFRPENLDAKHSMEFHQVDGIIVGRDVSFKHLLAFFKEFSAALGIKEVWFKPAYFPFTEPSVEGYIKHPKLGWVEVFPGGMFRPEVLEIVGVRDVNVAAWCFGVDRLAMAVLGIDDIRDLFSKDIRFLTSLKQPVLPFFSSRTGAKDVKVVENVIF